MQREVLKEHRFPARGADAPGRIVLCYLPDNEYTPFVTWWHNLQNGVYYWGDYVHTFEEAEESFRDRVQKG